MANSIIKDLMSIDDSQLEGMAPPSAKLVDWLHGNASSTQPTDMHRRQGFGPDDAARGDHNHDGVNSAGLFDGDPILADITAVATGAQIAAAVNALNAAFRALGAG